MKICEQTEIGSSIKMGLHCLPARCILESVFHTFKHVSCIEFCGPERRTLTYGCEHRVWYQTSSTLIVESGVCILISCCSDKPNLTPESVGSPEWRKGSQTGLHVFKSLCEGVNPARAEYGILCLPDSPMIPQESLAWVDKLVCTSWVVLCI